MANTIFQAKAYLSHWLNAVDEHSLHSPFFFDLYRKVIRPKEKFRVLEPVEKLRQQLLGDRRVLSYQDIGARGGSQSRTVAEIAKTSMAPASLSGVYSRLIAYSNARTVLEFGTSFGINTLYLAQTNPSTRVYTFEGVPPITDIAKLTFEFQSAKNVTLIEGNIDNTLPRTLEEVRKVDFVLMDANHRYAATIKYFNMLLARLTEKSVVVIDDIHYSAEMERAWKEIKNHELVYGSADLFRCGIVFFDPSLNKQHVILHV